MFLLLVPARVRTGRRGGGFLLRRADAVPGEPEQMEATMSPAHQRRSAQFHRRDDPGTNRLPRLDRNGWAVLFLASQGFHSGLHDRARLHGRADAGVSETENKDHRPQRRSGRRPHPLVERTSRRLRGHRVTYPLIGDPELKVAKAYDMPAGRGLATARPADWRRTTPRCARSSSSGRTRRSRRC